MNSLAKKTVIILSVAILIYVTAGYVRARSSDDKAYEALTVYTEVLAHIQRDYVDDPNMQVVTNGALHGLVDSLDPESSYLSPLEYKDYKVQSEKKYTAGAGLALTKRYDYISVISTLPDSPAQKANLRIGDIIEKIAGFTTSQMSIAQAQLFLSGEPGSVVKLSVIRHGKTEPEEIDLTLAALPPPKIVEDKLPDDVTYLRIPEFSPGMSAQLREKLVSLDHQGVHKLILDLRDCSLGDISEGISTAQLFLNSGTITTLKGQTVSPVVSSADPSKVVWTQPLTVLIGNGTSGPAEVLAAALADNHRAETIGDRTYGTASKQKLIPMDDGSAMILTVANYYTPAGKEIPVDGVAPTISVAPPVADSVAQMDQTLPPVSAEPVSANDPVIKKALDVLTAPPASQKKAA
ncbi:MAG TPA: S41 family peptidase [Candidatus Acidoferrum sp.]|nr:S41 family peptidase [Candidatus Acidoferrum sp.]